MKKILLISIASALCVNSEAQSQSGRFTTAYGIDSNVSETFIASGSALIIGSACRIWEKNLSSNRSADTYQQNKATLNGISSVSYAMAGVFMLFGAWHINKEFKIKNNVTTKVGSNNVSICLKF